MLSLNTEFLPQVGRLFPESKSRCFSFQKGRGKEIRGRVGEEGELVEPSPQLRILADF